MKFDLLARYLCKSFFVTGIFISFLTSNLSAWTVQVLDPANTTSGNNIPGNTSGRASFSTFVQYIKATESILSSGLLQNYNLGNSNAVIVNLVSSSYNDTELEVLRDLLNSNTRVLIFGEHTSWKESNQQLATLIGGNLAAVNGINDQAVTSADFPTITEGISTVHFGMPGKISPVGDNGHSLVSDDSLTLWGKNNNFLLFMDVDALSAEVAYNDQLARNIANWLSGTDINIPEPSTYALIAGFALLGSIIVRRRR